MNVHKRHHNGTDLCGLPLTVQYSYASIIYIMVSFLTIKKLIMLVLHKRLTVVKRLNVINLTAMQICGSEFSYFTPLYRLYTPICAEHCEVYILTKSLQPFKFKIWQFTSPVNNVK